MKLTRKQFCVLDALYEFDDGAVFDASGFAMGRLFNVVKRNTSATNIKWGDNISSILSWLEKNKFLRRDIFGKRTHRIRITKKGIEALRHCERLSSSQPLTDDRRTLSVIDHIKSRLDEGWTAAVIDSSDEYEIFILKPTTTTAQSRKLTKIQDIANAVGKGDLNLVEAFHEINNIIE